MQEMILKFIINGQTLTRIDTEKPVENSRGYLKAHFALPVEYSGTISAYFKYFNGTEWVGTPMPVDKLTGLCDVPSDCIVEGNLYVGLQSADTDIDIPTNAAKVIIDRSGVPKTLLPSPDGTPNEYQDFVLKHTEVIEKTAIAVDSATDAELSEAYAYDSEVNAKASEGATKASEDNAKTSETNAANSASTATAKADIASTKSNEASTSATNAATSATNAASSATTATTKASEASASATNAATSATSAATTAAEAITARTSTIKNKTFGSLDLRLEDIEYNSDTAIVDIKTGTTVQSVVSDDCEADLTKIEGGYTATKPNESADVSPSNVATITFPVNFLITSANSDASRSNTYTVVSEIRKLPNGVFDTTEKATDGMNYYNQKVGKVIFDGSADETWTKSARGSTGGSRFYTSVSDKKVSNSADTLLCNKLKRIEYSPGLITMPTASYVISGHNVSNTINIASSEFDSMTVTQFKAWLSANPITVYYELINTVSTLISDIKLVSYKGITNIATNASPQVNMTVAFKSRLNNAYQLLLERIVALEA